MNASKDNSQWSNRFQELLQACQVELKKTTQIGMKMLTASQSNTLLHEYYEKLGQMTVMALESNEIQWDNETAKEMVEKIKNLEEELSSLEKDVQSIKSED